MLLISLNGTRCFQKSMRSFKEGETVKLYLKLPDLGDYVTESMVMKMVKGRELNQRGGTTGWFTFNHFFLLEPAPGGALVTQREEYWGIAVLFWDASKMEAAFKDADEALKKRVESLDKKYDLIAGYPRIAGG